MAVTDVSARAAEYAARWRNLDDCYVWRDLTVFFAADANRDWATLREWDECARAAERDAAADAAVARVARAMRALWRAAVCLCVREMLGGNSASAAARRWLEAAAEEAVREAAPRVDDGE